MQSSSVNLLPGHVLQPGAGAAGYVHVYELQICLQNTLKFKLKVWSKQQPAKTNKQENLHQINVSIKDYTLLKNNISTVSETSLLPSKGLGDDVQGLESSFRNHCCPTL